MIVSRTASVDRPAAARPGRALAVVSDGGTDGPRVEPAARSASIAPDRRGDFLAHLIATREDFAQTRARRRAAPADAAAAYAAAGTMVSRGAVLLDVRL